MTSYRSAAEIAVRMKSRHVNKMIAIGALGYSLAGCSPAQIQAGAQLNCALAADGATVVGVIKPGYAVPANAASVVGCAAGTQIGQALVVAK